MLLTANYLKLLINIIFFIFQLTSAYNVDEACAEVYTEPASRLKNKRNSYFGYSVVLYTSHLINLLLIGAPRGNSNGIPEVEEPGAVYKCDIGGFCKEWIFSKSNNGRHSSFSNIHQLKNYAWIGASIGIENKNIPRIVICGPRWINEVSYGKLVRWYMNGICYSTFARNKQTFEQEIKEELIPLSSISQQTTVVNSLRIYNFGIGQAGFSLHMIEGENENDSNFLLGSPGIFNLKGSPILIKGNSSYTSPIVPGIRNEKNLYSNDYFGYSVTSGCYFKPGERLYASSAPRGGLYMNGIVFIFKFPSSNNKGLIMKKMIQGYQSGEYFGAALASCDLNNDGKDDLIIGSPQWSKEMDEGRVYIFMAKNKETSLETRILDGESAGGKFGLSVSCLGDIDHDNYGDLAVGAPYEGETGAIYIFYGEKNGMIKKQHSQKILGSIFSPDIRGFGFSISQSRDVNGDEYPDFAVGAYLSGHVVLLKSRQVITLITEIIYYDQQKLLKNSTFFFIDVCISYRGLYVPETLKIIKTIKLDETYERAFYVLNNNKLSNFQLRTTLRKYMKLCDQMKIHLKNNIQNIIDPLKIILSAEIDKSSFNVSKNCSPSPVIQKETSKIKDFIQLPFAVDCGEDNKCLSDLEANLSTDLENNVFVVGSAQTFRLNVQVNNYYEPAYQAKANIYIPEPLYLASIPKECMENTFLSGITEITCYMGNPLRKNKTLTLDLDASEIDFNNDNLNLQVNVSTQSDETSLLNNIFNLTVYFYVEFDIAIIGKTQENLINIKEEDQLNTLQFHHIYEIQKFGVSPVDEVVVTLTVPVFWESNNKQIQIAFIDQIIANKDNRQLQCNYMSFTNFLSSETSYKNSVESKDDNTVEIASLSQIQYNNNNNNLSIDKYLPPENRTFHINCTNSLMKCIEIKCELGRFESTQTAAKIILTLNLEFKNLKDVMDKKDIIFYISNGKVTNVEPSKHFQTLGLKFNSTYVATTFIGLPPTLAIAKWIIPVSIFLGVILFILLIFILIKLGFFHRRKKEELEALKAESNRQSGFTLEVTSSKEELAQDE